MHPAYLEVHQRLKCLQRDMRELSKQTPQLKTLIGDKRRESYKCVSQFVLGKNSNSIPVSSCLLQSSSSSS